MKRYMRYKILLFLLLIATVMTAANKKFTLVIDAGHGGHDAGAVGAITREKAINLNVALAFGRLVEQNCSDVKVVYTRKTDVFVPLHTRADIANRNKADLFISIHTNALPKGHISRGMETYTLGMHRAADNLAVAKRENEVILYEKDYKQRYQGFDPNSSESYIMFEFIQDHNMAQSVELAKFIQRRTCATAGRLNKGVKQAGFLVLRETSMPSCLVELGFISTRDEEQFLHSTNGVNQMAQGIYQAFLDYKRKYAPGASVPYKPEPQQEVSIPTVVPSQQQEEVKESKREKRRREKAEREAAEQAAAEKAAAEKAAAEKAAEEQAAAEKAAAEQASAIQLQPQGGQIGKVQQSVEINSSAGSAIVQPVPQQPEAKVQPAPEKPSTVTENKVQAPVFKVQIVVTSTKQGSKSPHLKGETDVDYYVEGGLYKYTKGASTNYNEILRLRKQLVDKFPQCFIIAFKNGEKMDVREAIREFQKKK